MRSSVLRCAAAAAVLVCAAQAADAQEVRGLSPVQLFAIAEQARVAKRFGDAETIYRALSRDPDLEIRTEARFRLGMMLAANNRKRDAAVVFRAILDEKPNAPRVRLELARLLAQLGDEAGARRELRQAEAAGLPPDVARVVDQFATALRSYRPFGGTFEVALAPDSNINRATDARTLDTVIAPLDLTRDARARSGLGLAVSGQVFARAPLSSRLALLPRVSGSGNLYRQSRFNDVTAAVQLGVERRSIAGGRLTVSGGQSQRWYGGSTYARTTTVSTDWLRPLGSTAQFTAAASAGRARYRTNDLQNGWLYDASIGLERALTPRSGGSLSLGLTRQTARDPGYANVAGGASALYFREIGRITAFASATVRRLEADERLFLFGERRREWLGRLGAGATFRQATVRGFAPVARVTFERNRSSVGLYDYRRLAMEIGIGRAF